MILPEHPGVLWHYTDSVGFLGIVTSATLRFGHVHFLNDSTEARYGLETVVRLLDPEMAVRYRLPIGPILSRLEPPAELFVCSFSEVRDSLSQWQRYGADGHGYSIAFDAEGLLGVLPSFVQLRVVRYDEKSQRERLREVIASLPENQRGSRATTLAAALNELLLEFKNPFFADEREWRLTCDGRSEDARLARVSFVPRSNIIKPYLELTAVDTRSNREALLPIRQVLCGPKLDADIAGKATRRFLAHNGYHDVEVGSSSLNLVWR